VVFREMGEYDEALGALEKVLDLKPKNDKAWMDKAKVLAAMKGRKKDAVEAYEKALEIKEDNAVAWFEKGALLESMRMTKKAEECYARAAELSPAYKEMLGMMKVEGTERKGIWTQSFAAEVPTKELDEVAVKGPVLGTGERPKDRPVPEDRSAETTEKELREGEEGKERDVLDKIKKMMG